MIFRPASSLLAGVALLAIAGASAASAQDVTLRFSNWLPPTHSVVTRMVEPWAADVAEATEGRVTVQILPALGAPPAHYDLTMNGVADLGFGVHAYTPERFKLTEIVELPFTAENALVNSLAYYRTYQEHLAKAGEHEGTKLLGMWTPGSYQLFTADTVESVEDLDGIRIRVPGALVEQMASALGMVSISSPLTEAYDQISRGIIDGMFQNYSTVTDFNMTEHMPTLFAVPGGFSASSQFLVVNQAAWDRIAPEDQAAIEALSGEAMVIRFAEVWQEENEAALEEMMALGVERHDIEGAALEEMQERLAFIEEDWIEAANARGVDGQAAIDFYRAQLDSIPEEFGVSRN